MVLVAVEPGLNGTPGELARVAFFVKEGHGGDMLDAVVPGASRGGVDGTEHTHLEVNRRLLHEGSPGVKEHSSKRKRTAPRQQVLLRTFAETGSTEGDELRWKCGKEAQQQE